jgi:malate dehydrogenase (oxaloacetate-decarboxylating)(NADP+)
MANRCWSAGPAVLDKLVELGVGDPESYRNPELRQLAARAGDGRDALRTPQAPRLSGARRERMVNQDRNVFAAGLLKLGIGDAMITGLTRTFSQSMREVRQVLDPKPGRLPFGIHLMVGKNYTVFLADTTVNERPAPPTWRPSPRKPPPSPAAGP